MGEQSMSMQEPTERRMSLGKGLIGVAAGGLGGAGVWLARRVRRRTPTPAPQTPIVAVLKGVPEGWRDGVAHAFENGGWRPWAVAGGISLMLFRLMELRQLRRLNRNLVAVRV